MPEDQGPKLIIDTDWKNQAQAEKERLAAQEKAKQPSKPASPAAAPGAAPQPGPEGDPEAMPQPDFYELVRMLATQALLYMGAFPDPESGRRMVSLEMAQFNIEMLGMLEDKTKNNLTAEENAFLSRMLYELRMQYVEIGKAVAKAVEQGRVQTVSPGGVVSGGAGPLPGAGPGLVTPG